MVLDGSYRSKQHQFKLPDNIAISGWYLFYRAVTAQAGNINSALCRSASNVLTLTVGAPPQSTATANTPVCAGTTLTLSASTGVSYQWTGPNGFTSAIQNPTINNVTAAAAGTYHVTVKSSSNCEVVVPVTVVVNAQPVAAVDAVEPICEGNSVTLNASGGSTYSSVAGNGPFGC
ncbi:PKD domain-containing protein [Mucilaginibacter sp. UC70_90]